MFNKVAFFWPGASLKMNFFIVIRDVFRTLSNIYDGNFCEFQNNNNNNNNNEFISAYPFYMKLALRPKIIYKKEILYCKILSNN